MKCISNDYWTYTIILNNRAEIEIEFICPIESRAPYDLIRCYSVLDCEGVEQHIWYTVVPDKNNMLWVARAVASQRDFYLADWQGIIAPKIKLCRNKFEPVA